MRSGERPAGWIDEHFTVDHDGMESAQRDHAWWGDHFAGANVECAVVEVTLDNIAVHTAFGQRAGAMSAVIVGHIKLVAEIEYGEDQPGGFNFDDTAFGNVGGRAEF